MSYRYPPRNAASAKARIARGMYTCYVCSGEFRLKDTQMDHKIPVVGVDGFVGWDDFIERLLPEEDGWGRICLTCHTKKTNEENEIRRLTKAKKADKIEE